METMLLVALGGTLVLAVAMAFIAWRLLRADRERTDARAAMLRQLAFEPEPALSDRLFQSPIVTAEPELAPVFGATADRTPPTSRRLMAVGVVIVFMAVGAASVYGIYGPAATGGPAVTDGSAGPATAGHPLELMSLSHRSEGEDFVVAGLVQNPVDGRVAASVMAVVYVFNDKGEYFASGKAALEFAPLAPGAESPFVVRLAKATGVTRFRVGFRAQDGSVVAHVDRRGQSLEGTTPSVNLPKAGGF